MGRVSLQLLLQLLLLLATTVAATSTNVLHPGCQEKCGNYSVPYPFGIGPAGCYRDKSFEITCKKNEDGVTMPFSGGINSTLRIVDFSLTQSQATMLMYIAHDCYNESGLIQSRSWLGLYLNGTMFSVSAARNKFTAIGCNTMAYMVGTTTAYESGCMSFCHLLDNTTSRSCTGTGCCQTSIPENLVEYDARFYQRPVNDTTWRFNPCSYSFVADQDWFTFDVDDLRGYNFGEKYHVGVPVSLDWVVENTTCEEAKMNSSAYACRSSNSECIFRNSPISGYTCNCSQGYEGNPYLPHGCKDINECELPTNPCPGYCLNTIGGFTCACPPGTHSASNWSIRNISAYGSYTCSPNKQGFSSHLGMFIAICVGGLGSSILSFLGFFLYRRLKLRNIKKHRGRCFHRNRGLLLQQLIFSTEDNVERTKIFTLEELEKATNNFDITRIVGRGGHGVVYKGILLDQRVVAIKKSERVIQSEIEQFINEVAILSQINHRNIVKLFGCCLETEVPLLVYEFISGGTLSDNLYSANHELFLSFKDRLRIAVEIAGALAYLHSATNLSVFHRDIKLSNILLNHKYTAKIADFGASRLIPLDITCVTTAVHGTIGYLDPEYYQTGQLTEKSDVYSFGVILVELLTGKRVISRSLIGQGTNLVMHFVSLFKERRLYEVLDSRIAEEGRKEELEAVALVAEMCLRLYGEERPTMKKVEQELIAASKISKEKHNVGFSQVQEGKEFVKYEANGSSGNTTNDTTRSYSLEKELLLSMNHPR